MMTTIAIAGILIAIVTANLGPARERSRIEAVYSSVLNARAAAALCVLRGATLSTPNASARGGNPMCAQTDIRWPVLPTAWSYSNIASNVTAQTFSYRVAGDSVTITCNQTECTEP